jgi:hypothetical protein
MAGDATRDPQLRRPQRGHCLKEVTEMEAPQTAAGLEHVKPTSVTLFSIAVLLVFFAVVALSLRRTPGFWRTSPTISDKYAHVSHERINMH